MSTPIDPAPGDNNQDPAVRFAGLSGTIGNWTRVGVIGLMALLLVWMVTISNPSMQKAHLEAIEKKDVAHMAAIEKVVATSTAELKAEREAARAETDKSRIHGTTAAEKLAESNTKTAEKISEAVEKSTDAITQLEFTLRSEQEKTRENNNRLQEIRMKKEAEAKTGTP